MRGSGQGEDKGKSICDSFIYGGEDGTTTDHHISIHFNTASADQTDLITFVTIANSIQEKFYSYPQKRNTGNSRRGNGARREFRSRSGWVTANRAPITLASP